MADNDDRNSKGSQRALIGAGIAAAAAAGAATFFFSRRGDGEAGDAPQHVLREAKRNAVIGRTVTINRSRQELYDRWKDFHLFPEFMENVESVTTIGGGKSRWVIKAPAGQKVELVTRITRDRPGESIAWKSEPDSDVETDGSVEFLEGAPGRGTMVRLTLRYDPPGGMIGRGIAKLLQREPRIQARRDLRRFKQLMETGEVATNAGPSGRGEPVTQATI